MTRTRTPPELKWVLNERAAVAGELQSIEAELTRLDARRRYLTGVLAALENVYCQLAPSIPRVELPSVRAHTRYGGRGNLINWLRATLQAAYPSAVDTVALTAEAGKAFGCPTDTPVARNTLRRNLKKSLSKLLARAEVERLHDYQGTPCMAGVWRWKPKNLSFGEVVEQAAVREAA